MNKSEVFKFFQILNMYKVSLYALKWMENTSDKNYEPIIVQNEYLLNRLQEFCINSIGFPEDF